MFRKILVTSAAALALFHGWLLADQAWSGQLSDLTLLARWIVAGGVFVGLVHLKRQGVSIISDRKAVAVWLLAALLHGPAIGERVNSVQAPAMPEIVAVLASVTIAGLAAAGLALLAALGFTTRRRAPRIVLRMHPRPLGGAFSLDHQPALAPRPPPIR